MRTFLILAAAVSALALAACNTVSGAGKDVSSVGNATTKGRRSGQKLTVSPPTVARRQQLAAIASLRK